MITNLHAARRNVIILQKNGGLMILLAYLLRTSVDWGLAHVRLKLVVEDASAAAGARANLREVIGDLRIGASSEVLVSGGRPFPEILRESSASEDLVFLGLAQPGEDFTEYYARTVALADDLPSTAFVQVGGEPAVRGGAGVGPTCRPAGRRGIPGAGRRYDPGGIRITP
ncbi:MAG TPA: hypothetical protein VML95_09140 [Longimicrobiales bacterium]|nr:hypothetical protein [Longimicrobiales bacterium]